MQRLIKRTKLLKIIFIGLFFLSVTQISQAGIDYPSQYNDKNKKTKVIYLIGLAGTGKYTIAKKISKQGYKLIDNHLINNPIFSLLGSNGAKDASESATEKIGRIRNIVFEFMIDDKESNYVLTNQLLQNDYHLHIYHKVQKAAMQKNSIFIPIVLSISSNERAKRIVQKERKLRFKITDPTEAYQDLSLLEVSHPNLLNLNVTHLTADEAAQKIIHHAREIQKNLSSRILFNEPSH